jgi:multicomponent Na+:H+ antiporter subunit F
MAEHFILIAAIVLILLIMASLITKTTVLLLLIGILYESLAMFVDIAIAYALLNFIATLGATKFFLRRRTTDKALAEAFLYQEDAESSKGGPS